MTEFQQAVEYVLKWEGGLEEDANDPGGITAYGISYRFLKSVKPETTEDDIRHLTRDSAIIIYKQYFWEGKMYDKILNQNVCNYLFDTDVNEGAAMACKIAQRALWSLNHDMSLLDDGVLGSQTLDAINHAGFLLLPPLRSERAGYYRLLIALNPNDKRYQKDWLRRSYT